MSPSAHARTEAELLPATDTLWCDVYHVIAPLADAAGAQTWRAHRTDTAEEVMLRVAPGAKGDARAEIWKRLCALDLPHLQRAREVVFVAEHRVEIGDALRGTPLDVWRAARATVEPATIETLVRQLAEALGVLHTSGLVHAGLRPSAIFVREENSSLRFILGSLESVTRFDGEGLVALPVDPRYAPPEAAGLEQHEPGPALCAWDWWALGRVVQEMILGQSIAASLPETQPGESVASRAETLLWERDPAGPRAGAVEIMPPLDVRLQGLLRGLLASAPEVRWNGDFVDRWLRQMPTKDNYGTRRVDKKFRWRGKLWEVSAAANELRSAALWPEAAPHVFERQTPGTLAHFLARSTEHKKLGEQLAETLKLAETDALRGASPEVARDVVLTVALAQVAEGGLVWRGRRIEGPNLGALLADEAANPERLALARALTHRNITAHIERTDFKTGRALAEVARVAADAEALLKRHDWVKAIAAEESARIFRLALESDTALRAAGPEALRRDFACSSQPAVDKIFQNPQPARAELVALAWVAPHAAQCGFVAHAAWQTQQVAALRERAAPIMAALGRVRQESARRAGPLVFGGWPLFAGVWTAAALLVAVMFPGGLGLVLALGPGLFALGLRFAAKPGKSADATERSGGGDGRDAAALEQALAEINASLAKLSLVTPPPAPVAGPPSFGGVRALGVAGWLMLGGVLALAGWRGATHQFSWSAFQAAWFPAGPDSAASHGEVKVSWPYRPGDDAQVIPIVATRPASSAEKAEIAEHGRKIVAPYRLETVNTLVIFRVANGDRIEVVVFDGQKRAPINDNIYTLQFLPFARAWIEVAERKGIYLDQ